MHLDRLFHNDTLRDKYKHKRRDVDADAACTYADVQEKCHVFSSEDSKHKSFNLALFKKCSTSSCLESFVLSCVKGIVHPKNKLYWTITQLLSLFLCWNRFGEMYHSSLAQQWILCSEWVPSDSERESKQLIKYHSNPHHKNTLKEICWWILM